MIVTWLIHETGNPLAMAWYLTGATVVGLIAMILIIESAPGHTSISMAATEGVL